MPTVPAAAAPATARLTENIPAGVNTNQRQGAKEEGRLLATDHFQDNGMFRGGTQCGDALPPETKHSRRKKPIARSNRNGNAPVPRREKRRDNTVPCPHKGRRDILPLCKRMSAAATPPWSDTGPPDSFVP